MNANTHRKAVAWVGHNLIVVENVDRVTPPADAPTLAQLIQEGFNRR